MVLRGAGQKESAHTSITDGEQETPQRIQLYNVLDMPQDRPLVQTDECVL